MFPNECIDRMVIWNLLKINWIYFQNWRNSQSPNSESNQSFLLFLLYFEQFELKLASTMEKFCERNQATHNLVDSVFYAILIKFRNKRTTNSKSHHSEMNFIEQQWRWCNLNMYAICTPYYTYNGNEWLGTNFYPSTYSWCFFPLYFMHTNNEHIVDLFSVQCFAPLKFFMQKILKQ